MTSFECTFMLIGVVDGEECSEEFEVNWQDLELLATDLSLLKPYGIPLIAIKFKQSPADWTNKEVESQALYFTTTSLITKIKE